MTTNYARLPRVLASVIYDAAILFAIIFVAAQWFPLIPENLQTSLGMKIFKQTYVLGIGYLYFAYSWQHGGQTIGMKSWRIKIVSSEDKSQALTWRQCAIRYAFAILSWLVLAGLGFVWILFSQKHESWHDTASKTRLIELTKEDTFT